MPIVPSRSRDIQKLIADLGDSRAATRESAVARLRLLGERALPPLLDVLRGARGPARLEALAVLEGLPGARSRDAILARLDDPDLELARRAADAAAAFPEATAALALARTAASGPPAVRRTAVDSLGRIHAAGVVEALEGLVARLLDEREEPDVRLAALDALERLPSKDLRPLLARLRQSRAPALAARARAMVGARRPPPAAATPEDPDGLVDALLASPGRTDLARRVTESLRHVDATAVGRIERALESTGDPLRSRVLAEALGRSGSAAAIPALRRLLDRSSARAAAGGDASALAEVKASAHRALAALGSRIALYDLREMLEARPALAAAPLLEAVSVIGDASFAATLAALAADKAAAFDTCAVAFADLVRREKLRRNSRALRSVRPEHRKALEALWKRAVAGRRDGARV